ncbi:hypothetical protein G6F55_014036 [Rhizopus delemar]|nr:hypothetical protein G6F55_014036 [Rhizopus delemar]
MDNASQVNVSLGRAPSNALFNVGGDLALAGTLNITDQGAFGAGVYRLFDYGGALTTNTLAIDRRQRPGQPDVHRGRHADLLGRRRRYAAR